MSRIEILSLAATVTQGLTSVQVSVHGPREPNRAGGGGGGNASGGGSSGGGGGAGAAGSDRSGLVVNVGLAPWAQGLGAGGRSRSRSDKRLLEIAASIRQTFEPVIMTQLYPRSEIAIHVQVLSADGGILPTAINATTLALIDSGISLLDYVTSTSIGLHLTQPLLDLSSPEESDLPTLVVASLPNSGKVTLAQMETRLHVDRFEEMLRIGIEACGVLKKEMEEVVKGRTKEVVERMNKGWVIGGNVGAAGTAAGGPRITVDA